MAIDSAAKRFSMLDFDISTQPQSLPPDNIDGAQGRLAGLWLYSFTDEGGPPPPSVVEETRNLIFGLGMMGKSSVHPHPVFSRHKQ